MEYHEAKDQLPDEAEQERAATAVR